MTPATLAVLPLAALFTLYCFLCGLPIVALINEERISQDRWLWTPIFGLSVETLVAANLNYLGVPVAWAAWGYLGIALVATLFIFRYTPRLRGGWDNFTPLLPAAIGMVLFLLPWLVTGSFPFLGDEFPYVSIGDFIRDHAYYAVRPPGSPYSQGQMDYAQFTKLGIGPVYALASFSSLAGVNSYSAFLACTATLLFLSFCGFQVLANVMVARGAESRIAALIYVSNVMFVLYPAALNFLRQTSGLVFYYAIFALMVLAVQSTSKWLISAAGLFAAALLIHYAEILPFLVGPLILFHLVLLIIRRISFAKAATAWAAMAAISFLCVAPWWLRSFQGFISQLTLRAGFNVALPLISYPAFAYGVAWNNEFVGVGRGSWASITIGLVLLGFSIRGLFRLSLLPRLLVISFVPVYAAAALELLKLHPFSYGFYKVHLYCVFLIALTVTAGITSIGRRRRALGLSAIWACFIAYTLADFTLSGYGTSRNPTYNVLRDAPLRSEFESLAQVTGLQPRDADTLIVVRKYVYAKWAAYFFGRRATLPFYPDAFPENAPGDAYILAQNDDVSFSNLDRIVFRNRLFSVSAPQTFVSITNNGWSDTEHIDGRPTYWMDTTAEILICSIDGKPVTLRGKAHLRPEVEVSRFSVLAGGQPVAHATLQRSDGRFEIGPIPVQKGTNRLQLAAETGSGSLASTSDGRAVLVERLTIAPLAPRRIVLPQDADLSVVGNLTEDGWVLGDGIHLIYERPRETSFVLTITGELPGGPETVPQVLEISAEGTLKQIKIEKGGPFSTSVPVQVNPSAEDTFTVGIKPLRTIVPKATGLNNDTRSLGFRLTGIELKH